MTSCKKTRHLRNLRRRVWERDGGVCQLCLEPIRDIRHMSLDHVIPKSKGGGSTFANLRASHGSCNNLRGNKDVVVGYLAFKKLTTEERISLQKIDEFDVWERYTG